MFINVYIPLNNVILANINIKVQIYLDYQIIIKNQEAYENVLTECI